MVKAIYHIQLKKRFWGLPGVPKYDVATEFVVVAKNMRDARDFAYGEGMDELHYNLEKKEFEYGHDNKVWTIEEYTCVEKIGIADHGIPTGVILRQTRDG